jgi:pimeloyl-ACP methyl ester carboxylesterase
VLTNGTTLDFAGRLQGDSLVGTWSGYGHAAPFSLHRVALTADAFRAESVTFHDGSVTLAGTVFVPIGRGRHPALVCIHGSGPVERSTYESKAIFLAEHGIAALVYDKRGTGQSTGDWQVASPTELARDAVAGIELLRQRPDIDPTRIGAEGFSQGGWIAPLAATLSNDVAFVVVGSAAGLTPAEQSIYDIAGRLAAAGFDTVVIRRASTLRRKWYSSAHDAALRRDVIADLATVHTEPWFRVAELPFPLDTTTPPPGPVALLELEPRGVWQRVSVPVLAYWGSRDPRLPVDSSITVVTSALRAGGNHHVTTHVFPGADHVMALPSLAPWDFPRTAPFFTLIADWIPPSPAKS